MYYTADCVLIIRAAKIVTGETKQRGINFVGSGWLPVGPDDDTTTWIVNETGLTVIVSWQSSNISFTDSDTVY